MKKMTDNLTVREIKHDDPPTIAGAFRAQGWNKPQDQYEKYYRDQMAGKRTVLAAELEGEFVGYLTIVWESHYPSFRNAGIPEVVDCNVLVAQQRKGIGTILMNEAELGISEKSRSQVLVSGYPLIMEQPKSCMPSEAMFLTVAEYNLMASNSSTETQQPLIIVLSCVLRRKSRNRKEPNKSLHWILHSLRS